MQITLLKFGIHLPNIGPFASSDSIRAVAKESEELGYDSVWANDHVVWDRPHQERVLLCGSKESFRLRPKPVNVYDSISTMAFVAGITERLAIGPMVLQLPLRNPVILAKQTATIDDLSGGRLVLNIGLGTWEKEFASVGVPWKERSAIADESLQVLKILWSQTNATFSGRYFAFSDVELFPKPVQKPHPPIGIGGNSRAALRRACKYGEIWAPGIGTMPIEIEAAQEYVKSCGYARDRLKVYELQIACIAHDSREAKKKAAPTLNSWGSSHAEAEGVPFERRLFVGCRREIVDKIEQYGKSVDTFILAFIADDLEEYLQQMRIFSKKVSSSFR